MCTGDIALLTAETVYGTLYLTVMNYGVCLRET